MIYLFGCSHTRILYLNYIKDNIHNIVFKDCSSLGNSNQKIIWDVYQVVNSKKFDKKNDILVIQYTYTNRWWRPNILPHQSSSFHSFSNQSPIYRNNKPFDDELLKFYSTFIKFFWDSETSFTQHLMDIEFLKTYLDVNKIKYIHYCWTDNGNPQEWNQDSIDIENKQVSHTLLENLNCEHFENNYLIGHWVREKGWTQDDDHIKPIHHKDYFYKILDKIYLKFDSKIIEKRLV